MTAPEPVDLSADPLAFGPPEQTVWKKYSPNLEFPISLLISTFFLTSLFAILVGLLFLSLGNGPAKKIPPMSLVEGGEDDSGNGSPGSGGTPQDTQLKTPQQPATSGAETPKEQAELPAVKDIQHAIAIEDPSAPTPAIAPENANSLSKLDDALRNKLLGIGQKGPNGLGKGDTGQPGAGPGGSGADATRNRSLRWVMRFQTSGGRDYLDQLMALGAVVLVKAPQPGQMYIFRDLRSPKPGVVATDAELASFSQQMQFCDSKRQSGEEVGKALNLSYTPDAFWAIFPKGIEEELARLEKAYRGRRAADVEQTIFAVSVVAGKYRLVVTDQTPRLGR
jgi:hypothetical protein